MVNDLPADHLRDFLDAAVCVDLCGRQRLPVKEYDSQIRVRFLQGIHIDLVGALAVNLVRGVRFHLFGDRVVVCDLVRHHVAVGVCDRVYAQAVQVQRGADAFGGDIDGVGLLQAVRSVALEAAAAAPDAVGEHSDQAVGTCRIVRDQCQADAVPGLELRADRLKVCCEGDFLRRDLEARPAGRHARQQDRRRVRHVVDHKIHVDRQAAAAGSDRVAVEDVERNRQLRAAADLQRGPAGAVLDPSVRLPVEVGEGGPDTAVDRITPDGDRVAALAVTAAAGVHVQDHAVGQGF